MSVVEENTVHEPVQEDISDIDSSDSGPESLPSSATCSNALYLPNYTSVEQATQKMRYAAYNCVAIDTDMSPWDE